MSKSIKDAVELILVAKNDEGTTVSWTGIVSQDDLESIREELEGYVL